MSLHTFKQTLKPCTTHSSSYSSLSQLDSTTIINHRKPPKSSLSRQLLRLQDPAFLPHIQTQTPPEQTQTQTQAQTQLVDVKDEHQEIKVDGSFGRSKLDLPQFDHTGPYEPLLLSSPGETPVVQVGLFALSFCLT